MTRRLLLVAKVVFGAAWVLFAAEYYLRILHPVPVVPRYVTAAEYGIRCNEPNRTYTHTSADYRISIRTNSKGIRSDEEIPYEKPAGVCRILVLGDSFGMGYEVDLEDTFLVRMENALSDAGHAVQVVNLSVSGHSNAEQLLALQHEGLKYQPDVVLLCWHRSDLSENVRSGLFALEGEMLVRGGESYLPGVAIQEKLYGIPGYDWIQSHSNLYAFTREWVSWNLAKPLLLALRSRPAAAETEAPSEDPVEPMQDYPGLLTIALLKEIEATASSSGARFAVLDIPDHHKNIEFISRFPYDLLQDSDGLPVIGVHELFKDYVGQVIYWTRSQRHFTPLGCKIVGEHLAQELLRMKIVTEACSLSSHSGSNAGDTL